MYSRYHTRARWLASLVGSDLRRLRDLRAAILALLQEEPRNGYQIMQELKQRSQGVWNPSPGSVYPALQLLEDERLTANEEGAGGRVYALTSQGKVYVKEHADETLAEGSSEDK
jgi:DNA-binding PadR family transcriptional regulator